MDGTHYSDSLKYLTRQVLALSTALKTNDSDNLHSNSNSLWRNSYALLEFMDGTHCKHNRLITLPDPTLRHAQAASTENQPQDLWFKSYSTQPLKLAHRAQPSPNISIYNVCNK